MNERLIKIEKLIRDVPDFPKPGIVFKDITPLIGDPEGLSEVLRLLAEPLVGTGLPRRTVRHPSSSFCHRACRFSVWVLQLFEPGLPIPASALFQH